MFQGWHDLYLVLGPASAGLIGLLFVVVTLTAGGERRKVMRGAQIYMTPIVFHLGVLVLLTTLALFPDMPALAMGGAAVIAGMLGLTYAGYVCRALLSRTLEFASDLWCYGYLVALLYMTMIIAGLVIVAAEPVGPYMLAIVQIALYLLMVNNAWDLVLFITPRKDDPPPDDAGV